MTRRRQPVDSSPERWPLVSLRDNRSLKTRRSRPFGAAAWRPRDADNWRIYEKLIEIRDRERQMALDEGRIWLGLGSRQYAYRLKTAEFMFVDRRKLTKKDFERVERVLVRARRDDRLDLNWGDVADGRGIFGEPDAYSDNGERLGMLAVWASRMSHDRMKGQKIVPELAVETEGLYNLIYDLADRYGARHMGLQGQSAVKVRYDLAQRVGERWASRIRTRVLGVTDSDKQGDEILGAIAADAAQHLRDMGIDPDQCLGVKRVALTELQISEYDIPTVEKDGRQVQEAEALPTDVLRTEVEAALADTLDMNLFDRVAQDKTAEIIRLAAKIRRLRA
jgi:hypothetical protein